jgi:hypothetical protein
LCPSVLQISCSYIFCRILQYHQLIIRIYFFSYFILILLFMSLVMIFFQINFFDKFLINIYHLKLMDHQNRDFIREFHYFVLSIMFSWLKDGLLIAIHWLKFVINRPLRMVSILKLLFFRDLFNFNLQNQLFKIRCFYFIQLNFQFLFVFNYHILLFFEFEDFTLSHLDSFRSFEKYLFYNFNINSIIILK